MKTKVLFSIVLLAALQALTGLLWAQETYCPLLEDGKTWIVARVHATWEGSPFRGYGSYDIYTLRGDSIVDSEAWKQLYCYRMTEQGEKWSESRVALLREEDGRVFFYDEAKEAKKLLMDFSVSTGDVLTIEERAIPRWSSDEGRTLSDVIVTNVSTYTYGGHTLKRIDLKWPDGDVDEGWPYEFSWVEGVGAIEQEPFNNDPIGTTGTFIPRLAECQVNGEVLYRDEAIYAYMHQTLPEEFPAEREYLPLFGEGRTGLIHYYMANGYEWLCDVMAAKEQSVDGIQFWRLTEQRLSMEKEVMDNPTTLQNGYVGEKSGKLYFWKGSEEQAPYKVMDFSLTAGNSLEFQHPAFMDDLKVRLEVKAAGDTVFSNSTDRVSRRCLHVTYNVEYHGTMDDIWVEGIGSLTYGTLYPYFLSAMGARPSLWECREDDALLYAAPGNPAGIAAPTSRVANSSRFDLQGRQLPRAPQRGVFIENGRLWMR